MTLQALEIKKKRKMIKAYYFIKSFLPLLLSHHPQCGDFESHTLKFKKYRLCIGCFIGYPSAFLGIILLGLLHVSIFISSEFLFSIGFIFISFFFLSPLGLIKNKLLKVFQKSIIGIGSSFVYWGIRLLLVPRSTKYLLFAIIFGIILTFLNLYHTLGFLKTCQKCKTPFNWAICDGFKDIRENLVKYGLRNYLDPMRKFSFRILEKRKVKIANSN